MKIEITEDYGILLRAETEFEQEFIDYYCPHGKVLETFKKCGVDTSDIVGLKIKPCEDDEDE